MSLDWFLNPVMNQYADFSGRATRQAYWMFALIQFLISFALGIIGGITGMEFLSFAFSLAVLVPGLAIGVRRLHDVGKSGWWFLIILIPFIGFIILIVFLATKGDTAANAYGPATGMSAIPVPVAPTAAAEAMPVAPATEMPVPTPSETGEVR